MNPIKRTVRTVCVLFVMMTSAILHASEVGENEILAAARKWIADNAVFKAELPDAVPEKAVQMADFEGKELPLWRVDLQPTGYLVMSADDTLPPVVAFNTNGAFDMPGGHPLSSMLNRQGAIFQKELDKPRTRGNGLAEENKARWNRLLNHTRAESTTPSTIIRQPMLTMEWNQGAPYNYFCPSGSTYMQRALTGCVATAAAQMMKYHEWPVAGKGTKSHTDGKGDVQGSVRADFTIPYDWEAMEDNYTERNESNYGNSEFAVARLSMELGVLVEADYGMDETSARSSKLHTLMAQYLGYSDSAVYGSESGFYSRIRTEMVEGRPAFVTYTQENNGHMFIVDGLGTMGGLDYYHFNYGWGGHMSGWYLLTDGYKASVIDSATTNIQPEPIPIFKPMSCEQTSSFTLSWDFPKRLTAEAFRLTKTNGTRASTVISSSIAGTARSYTLSGQSGTATYMLEAKVGGSWQAASNGVTVTIKTNPVAMLSLSQVMEEGGDDGRTSIAGETATMMFEANNSLASLTVTSSRPDILPDSGISVTSSGKKRTIQLTPFNDKIGNVLLYVTACDAAGNIIRQTIPFKVMAEEVLTWYTSKAEAMTAATEKGKRVLLVTGHDGCYYTNNFRNSVCEISDIKADLLANYVLWYCNLYTSSEYSPYVSGLGNTFPWIAIIDPANSGKRMRGHGGPVSAAETRMFLNKSIPYFSLNTNKTYDFGSKQTLELSILAKDADIYYRLDDQEPTPSDTLYSTPIQLTETTTVSACAYKNGVPLDDYVTKTYNFSTLTELPDGLSIATGTGVTMYSATKPWALQTTTYNSAPSAMQSGSIGDDATSILVAKVIGSGTLTFYWKASCENGYDILNFSIDGTSKASISGLTEWARKSYTVTGAGEHYLIWTYAKDSSDYENDDCGWVDDIVWNGNGPDLKTITINGDSIIASGATATYTCTAKWSDGTTSTVTPTWSLSSTTYASVDNTGKVTNKNITATDQTVTLNATYTHNGVTETTSKNITLARRTLVAIAVDGSDSIESGSSATYTCKATWSDGITTEVKPSWNLNPGTYANINTNGKVTNQNTTANDQTVMLTASYTFYGVSKTATKNVTLKKRVLQSIDINGIGTIYAGDTVTYSCVATWSDGTTTAVMPEWSLSSSQYASVDANGKVTHKNTTDEDQTVKLNATYTNDGVTKTASKTITLVERVLTYLAINGDDTISSGSTATYAGTATWSDGATTTVMPTWSLSNTTMASVDATGKVTNQNTTVSDYKVTLTATYTHDGITKTASKTITLAKRTLASIAINGNNTISSGGAENYTCTATWSDGATTTVTPTWSLSPTPYASVDATGKVTNKNTTDNDQNVTLNASYTVGDVTKTATKVITLEKRTLTDISIVGDDVVATGGVANYSCTAAWSYGDSTVVTPTWNLSSTNYASIDATGKVTNKNATDNDQTVTLTASYTVGDVTQTAMKVITLSKRTLKTIAIDGEASIASGKDASYTCTATWSYGDSTVVTPAWGLSDNTYASVDTGGKVTNKNVTDNDQTVMLTASYTVGNVTKTTTKVITLSKRTLMDIIVNGDETIDSGESATYTCTATWSYGDSTVVTPTWSFSSADYASVDADGKVTNRNTTTTDQTVKLTASYTVGEIVKTAEKVITLKGMQQPCQTLELHPGWNLVTLTRQLVSNVDGVQKFLSLKPMMFDTENFCYVFCDNADAVKPGVGYWVFSKRKQTIELAQDVEQAVSQTELQAGWNLVGLLEESTWPSLNVEIWTWRNGRFKHVDKNDLRVGCTYWVLLY